MDSKSYEQYLRETDDWLKTARARLLHQLVARHRPSDRPLELLEVGAGAGQNLPTLSQFGVVDAIEVNSLGREAINARNVTRSTFAEAVPFPLERRYDVICALDVIEHLPDDREALQWMHDLLRPEGLLVITVPAYQWLFSDHDRALGHFRRYTRPRLQAALPPRMDILGAGYFTHFAFPLAVCARAAWSLKRMGRAEPAKQASPRGRLVERTLARLHDAELALIARGYQPPFGLSAYLVARRNAASGA